MPLILPGNVASALGGAYEVANSCRFNDGDSAYMHKTPSSDGNRRTFTFSFWVKRGELSSHNPIAEVYSSGENVSQFYFNAGDQFTWYESQTSNKINLTTNAVQRDPNAWYHIVVKVDTTESTNTDRVKIYINNELQTITSGSNTYPDQNFQSYMNSTHDAIEIGRTQYNSNQFDGYLAEVCMIDGSALAPSSFGEADEDSPTIWKPIDVSGLTFGTNGFYLDFEDSSNLGNDANGGTDLTEVNLAATDQAQDSPTNNWAVLNPLDHYYNATTSTGGTLSEGSTLFVIASGNKGFARSSIGVTAGKWYWECKLHAVSKGFLGVCNNDILVQDSTPQVNAIYLYEATPDFRSGDQILTTGVASISTNDIMNFALDMENHAFYIGVNNSWMNSGDPTSGDSRTGAISELFTTGRAIIRDSGAMFANLLNTSTSGGINTSMNFGCPPYANSSDAADANGFGAFEFSPPAGYLALCTKNLGSDGG